MMSPACDPLLLDIIPVFMHLFPGSPHFVLLTVNRVVNLICVAFRTAVLVSVLPVSYRLSSSTMHLVTHAPPTATANRKKKD